MIIAGILFNVISGAVLVYFSCGIPDRIRYNRIGYGLLILSAAGLCSTGITTILCFCNKDIISDGGTLFQMFFITAAAAAAACIIVEFGAIFTSRQFIRPLTVLVPFLWAILLLLWTWMCGSWAEKPGTILFLGISLCAVLLVCPAAAFLRASAALKREGALQKRLEEIADKKEKKAAKKTRRIQKKRLRAPRKRSGTK